ncbi:hypothetical protein F5148DRAFT_1150091 [Russula earlei]|uniref:Uncharacterized protein n=1 Tax=Russula earlei TaxID=71964 RepID=A0ACC0U5I5_9AGAM|nr:hypothetical protein F5148DRAFT_1150091 [Russula earlei]
MTATISKGTLNLRFMQNAQRAEQGLEVKSVETVPNDESHWEVAKEVKEMWGMTSDPSSSLLVSHEASYLPFILSRSDASGSPPQPIKLRGRRTWNKRGQEVTEVELPPDDKSRGWSSSVRQDSTEHQPTSKRLTSISSLGPGSSTKEIKRSKSRSAKSARELIHEALPSGTREIRINSEGGDASAPTTHAPPLPPRSAPSPNEINEIDRASPTPKFLKPAGVEEPSEHLTRRDGSHPARGDAADTNHGARRQNPKRERDDHREAGASTADKKRKKSGAAAAA